MPVKEFYTETQKFRQTWIKALIFIITAIAWYAFIQQILMGKSFGDQPSPDLMIIIIFIVIGLGLPLMFYYLKMVTIVNDREILIRFIPFYKKPIRMENIKSWQVRQYRPFRDYGGWGIRWSPTNGMAYIVSGNKGVQLVLINNKKVLIGSDKPEELAKYVSKFKNRKNTFNNV